MSRAMREEFSNELPIIWLSTYAKFTIEFVAISSYLNESFYNSLIQTRYVQIR